MSGSGTPRLNGPAYRGRFAPSPTGPLHFGSLIAALASFLQARSQEGTWLVRIEDLDPPREVAGASSDILHTLEALGFEWEGDVLYQSQRDEAYQAALQSLLDRDRAYPCGCSRREIAALQDDPKAAAELYYPGTCRHGLAPGRQARAWRVLTDGRPITFEDRLQGLQRQQLDQTCGDFVIRRADGLFAYQLAVAVDDAAQHIREVVRGCDLLDSTPRQIHLQRLLGLATPDYVHVPVAMDRYGDKLSKQTGAAAIDPRRGAAYLTAALEFLGQSPPADLKRAVPREVLSWARAHWRLDAIPRQRGIVATGAISCSE